VPCDVKQSTVLMMLFSLTSHQRTRQRNSDYVGATSQRYVQERTAQQVSAERVVSGRVVLMVGLIDKLQRPNSA
jgi:hypothetical protein